MSKQMRTIGTFWLLTAVLAWPMAAVAQVPVDAGGKPVGQVEAAPAAGAEDLQVLSAAELKELIGPIALYPDDLLAIILPASTYPLQIVQAARFLEDLKNDSSLEPDDDWDDSVVALTNYPEVVEMMNDDLDWTWRLGEAVVAQQTDVIKAIEEFRDRAYAAGNLKSDDFQNVTEEDGAIQITPVEDDVIYVPYYEPERVVVYQPRPVYYYYPRPYPLYYYPYPAGYAFDYGYFWGVTTAFHIGWFSHDLRIWHPSYYGHPYYGYTYWNNWWYRRPDIHVYNNYYVRNPYNVSRDRYRRGDYWQPQTRRTVRSSDQRLTRTRYYPNVNRQSTSTSATTRSPATSRVRSSTKYTDVPKNQASEPKPTIRFRDREGTATSNRGARTVKPSTATSSSARQSSRMLARQSEPAPTYTRPTQPKTTYTRPTQPRQSYSRPSQPKASSSRAVQPRQSSAPRSKSAPSNSASNKRASASSSRNTSRKR